MLWILANSCTLTTWQVSAPGASQEAVGKWKGGLVLCCPVSSKTPLSYIHVSTTRQCVSLGTHIVTLTHSTDKHTGQDVSGNCSAQGSDGRSRHQGHSGMNWALLLSVSYPGHVLNSSNFSSSMSGARLADLLEGLNVVIHIASEQRLSERRANTSHTL